MLKLPFKFDFSLVFRHCLLPFVVIPQNCVVGNEKSEKKNVPPNYISLNFKFTMAGFVLLFYISGTGQNADKLKYNARHHIDHIVRRRNTSKFVAFFKWYKRACEVQVGGFGKKMLFGPIGLWIDTKRCSRHEGVDENRDKEDLNRVSMSMEAWKLILNDFEIESEHEEACMERKYIEATSLGG